MSTIPNTEKKIDLLITRLDGGRQDHLEEVLSMRKALKQAMLKKNFKEHPALKLMIDTLRKRNEAYSLVLSDKRELTEINRREYFARRDEVRWLLSFFEVDRTIETIEKRIDYQLSDDVEEGGDSDEE